MPRGSDIDILSSENCVIALLPRLGLILHKFARAGSNTVDSLGNIINMITKWLYCLN